MVVSLGACGSPPNSSDGGDEKGDTSAEESTGSGTTAGTETGENLLPPAPTLSSPEDGAIDMPLEVDLCWNMVDDPDGDALRYRVYVDDIELTPNRPDDESGYLGPCTGPLLFDYENTYSWRVQAFEAEAPERSSDFSETWTFTVDDDGMSQTVFEDDFDQDLGWEVEGDAITGAWVLGNPELALDGEETSQPTTCFGNDTCYFTGHNRGGMADDEDVAGGSTVLLSPTFDLGGAATATVQLARYFYKSDLAAGPGLRIELLVPDDDDEGEWQVHELEFLGASTLDDPQNLWLPREWAACDAPMRDGSRLRVTATDDADGILEGLIDSVSVHAHFDRSICADAGALGSICEPGEGDGACSGDALCCSQGAVNQGVYRCVDPVPGLDFQDPPDEPDDPGNGAMGCNAPDLFIDETWVAPIAFTDIWVDLDTCVLWEQCVGDVGVRTIMRFTVSTPNIGSDDLVLGVPANNPDLFHFSDCHNHHHFDEYARYEVWDDDANTIVATGHKQSFCLLDFTGWAWPFELPQFDCANQGISRGFTDYYQSDLPCQWVDVTEVAPGDYTLRISLNQPRPDAALPVLNERDYANNVLEVPVTIP